LLPTDAAIDLSVSDFVALLNQTLEFAYPTVNITGELANFRVSRNRWLYFDLKDEFSSVKFFGTVYQLPGPLEDGMLLKVRGQPRLHNLYGFSVNVLSLQPAGEGSLRKAADLLQAKLAAEGLFDEARKRPLPYAPAQIGLITSKQSAAYADFIKIINARWQGIEIELIDVQVQGEAAPAQIVAALETFSELAEPPQVVVLVRGGGSAEDLAAFSNETVVRAVAASRVPTLIAIGHEVDTSLAELTADRRASTPSNAAELLVPDRQEANQSLRVARDHLNQAAGQQLQIARAGLNYQADSLEHRLASLIRQARSETGTAQQLLAVLNPAAVLKRGYAIVRAGGKSVRDAKTLKPDETVEVQLAKGGFTANIKGVNHA
jgi:exodeoxyribonuclease VII large subunit